MKKIYFEGHQNKEVVQKLMKLVHEASKSTTFLDEWEKQFKILNTSKEEKLISIEYRKKHFQEMYPKMNWDEINQKKESNSHLMKMNLEKRKKMNC